MPVVLFCGTPVTAACFEALVRVRSGRLQKGQPCRQHHVPAGLLRNSCGRAGAVRILLLLHLLDMAGH